MIMNDDLIFEDEDFLVEEPQEPAQEEPTNQESPAQELDLTTEVLKLKGISDPSKIKFEDESGAVIERPWDQLSVEEQLNILAGEEPQGYDLQDDEIDLINAIRDSKMSVNDYIQSLIPKQEEQPPVYKVDSLSDEELYALDLLEKVGSENITDEELTEAIDNAKKNESLFKKTVEGLRNEYIRLQQEEEARVLNAQQAEKEEAYNRFSTSIQNEIKSLNSFAGQPLELSNNDIEDLSAFMLELDDQGVSAFGRAMQDPQLFTRAAFWILNEEQIIEELNNQIKETYRRGYENGKKDSNKPSPLAIKPASPTAKESAYIDDDDW